MKLQRRVCHLVWLACLSSCLFSSTAFAQEEREDFTDTAPVSGVGSYLRSTASARQWLIGPGYSIMGSYRGGAHAYSPRDGYDAFQPQTYGYRIQERNGFVSGFLMALFTRTVGIFAVSAIASNAYEDVLVEEQKNPDGTPRWVYHPAHPVWLGVADSTNVANMESVGELVGWRLQNFELDIFSQDWLGQGRGETSGWRANFLLVMPLGRRLALEGGYGWGRALSFDPGNGRVVNSQFSGVPLRLLMPVGPLLLQAGWDLNFRRAYEYIWRIGEPLDTSLEHSGRKWEQENVRPWPLYLGAHLLLWRLHAEVSLEVPRVLRREVGYKASVGVRF